jgi:hypothetical protein
VTTLRAGRPGFDSRQGQEFFSLRHLGPTQSPIQWVPGDLSPVVKRLGHEADHSSISAEFKSAWSVTSTPPVCVHGVVLN